MIQSPIRYGILGCGEHALISHAMPAKELKTLSLTALCDISPSQMTNFCEQYGAKIPKYRHKQQFARAIDAVVIATPDRFHTEDLAWAINNNLHVLVEKPIATEESQIRELSDLLKKANKQSLIVTSCHLRRYDPPIVWLKESLPELEHDLGKLVSFEFDFSYHKSESDWKQNRSLLLDHVNHEIDLVNFLFGKSSFDAYKLHDSADRYEVSGVRDDGLSFKFIGTRMLDTAKYLEFIHLRFSRGTYSMDLKKGLGYMMNHQFHVDSDPDFPKMKYEVRSRRVMENFANSILGIEKPYLTPDDLIINTTTGVKLSKHTHWRCKI